MVIQQVDRFCACFRMRARTPQFRGRGWASPQRLGHLGEPREAGQAIMPAGMPWCTMTWHTLLDRSPFFGGLGVAPNGKSLFLVVTRLAERTGLETATSAVTGQRSNQLSYRSNLGLPGFREGVKTSVYRGSCKCILMVSCRIFDHQMAASIQSAVPSSLERCECMGALKTVVLHQGTTSPEV